MTNDMRKAASERNVCNWHNPGSRYHGREGQLLELNPTRKPRPRNGAIDPKPTPSDLRSDICVSIRLFPFIGDGARAHLAYTLDT